MRYATLKDMAETFGDPYFTRQLLAIDARIPDDIKRSTAVCMPITTVLTKTGPAGTRRRSDFGYRAGRRPAIRAS